jgi:hypothetical protein
LVSRTRYAVGRGKGWVRAISRAAGVENDGVGALESHAALSEDGPGLPQRRVRVLARPAAAVEDHDRERHDRPRLRERGAAGEEQGEGQGSQGSP